MSPLPKSKTLKQQIDANAAEHGDRIWLASPETGRQVSFADGAAQIRDIAQHIANMGLPKGSSIAIASPNSISACLTFMGIVYGGYVALPLNLVAGAKVLGYTLAHSEAALIFVQSDCQDMIQEEALGMPDDVFKYINETVRKPNGIFICTGPTGAGKTTTLYAALKEINTIDSKLLTAEDPVEYDVDGIIQVPVNEGIGLSFSRVLRAFLRQDPDRILVGEIRDLDTAQIAIQASLTGHLVLSTLHTNDAPGAVTRLVDMGTEPFLVAASLEGVLAQRLLRTICKDCKASYEPNEALLNQLGVSSHELGDKEFHTGKGCDSCDQSGYKGRRGLFELLDITDPIRDLITDRAPTVVIKQKAIELGMETLREDGLRNIYDGNTTIEEVLKYT